MRWRIAATWPAVAVAVAVGAGRALADPGDATSAPLQGGVRLEVAGTPIDVSVGHAAPCVVDWDGDGRHDLLVGEFGGGTLRFFRNVGEKGAPRLEAAGLVAADGKNASVPSG